MPLTQSYVAICRYKRRCNPWTLKMNTSLNVSQNHPASQKSIETKISQSLKISPETSKNKHPPKKVILGKESFFLAQPVAYRCRDPKTIIRILHLKDLWKTNWDPVPASVNLNLPRGSGLVQFHRVQYQCYQLSHLQQGTSSLINKVESICILRMEANSTI